jgi:hypothetical protein
MYIYNLLSQDYWYEYEKGVNPIVMVNGDYVLTENSNAINCYLTRFEELEKYLNCNVII